MNTSFIPNTEQFLDFFCKKSLWISYHVLDYEMAFCDGSKAILVDTELHIVLLAHPNVKWNPSWVNKKGPKTKNKSC